MGEKIGKLIICDRCSKMVFVERKGETEMDGGYTRNPIHEKPPKGWEWHGEVGQLCPDCNAEYTEFLKGFMQREKK